jgi:hypothetical protein
MAVFLSSLVRTRPVSGTTATVAVALLLFLTILLAAGAIPAARAAPTLVQQASGGGLGTSYTITLTGVTAGDLIVVSESEGVQDGGPSFPPAITDTQLNTYTAVVQKGNGNTEGSIWYTIASASGSDTVKVTLTDCTDFPCGNNGAVVYELSGFTAAGAVSSSGLGGSAGCCSVTSFTPPMGSFVVAAMGELGWPGPWTAGSGYTLSTEVAANMGQTHSEYLVGWSSGSTTAPFTPGGTITSGGAWAEVAAAFPVEPVVTTTSTGTVITTQTVIKTDTVTNTVTSTQLSTTTVTTGFCPSASESISPYGPGIIRQATVSTPGPTITDTASTTVTSTVIVTSVATVTNTATTTTTGTVTQTTCAPGQSPPTGVPQFPLASLGPVMLVALLLPVALLMNRMRSGRRPA